MRQRFEELVLPVQARLRADIRVVIPDAVRPLVLVLEHRIQGTLLISSRAEELCLLFVGALVSEPPHDVAFFGVSFLRQLEFVGVPLAVLAADPQLAEGRLFDDLILDVKGADFLLELVGCVSDVSVLRSPPCVSHVCRILRASQRQ